MQKYFNAYLKIQWKNRTEILGDTNQKIYIYIYINLVGTVARRIETYCMGFIAKTSAKNGQRA